MRMRMTMNDDDNNTDEDNPAFGAKLYLSKDNTVDADAVADDDDYQAF